MKKAAAMAVASIEVFVTRTIKVDFSIRYQTVHYGKTDSPSPVLSNNRSIEDIDTPVLS
jgi:hypothetical protein